MLALLARGGVTGARADGALHVLVVYTTAQPPSPPGDRSLPDEAGFGAGELWSPLRARACWLLTGIDLPADRLDRQVGVRPIA